MSFFGLTMLGGGEVFKEYSPNRPMVLAAVADDKYAEAFDMHKLGDTTIAEDCQVCLCAPGDGLVLLHVRTPCSTMQHSPLQQHSLVPYILEVVCVSEGV